MGRKSIPDKDRRRSISVTLPPNLITYLECNVLRRSLWIEGAIKSKINDTDSIFEANIAELIMPILVRTSNREQLTDLELQVLQQIYNRILKQVE